MIEAAIYSDQLTYAFLKVQKFVGHPATLHHKVSRSEYADCLLMWRKEELRRAKLLVYGSEIIVSPASENSGTKAP